MKTLLRTALAAACALMLLPAAAQAAAPGINVVYGVADAQKAIDQGAQQVRFFVPWDVVQPTENSDIPAHPAMTVYRQMTQTIMAAGRTPIVVFVDSPAWASFNGQAGRFAPAPDRYDDFARAFRTVITDLASQGTSGRIAFEVWNEADGPEFWGTTPNAAAYTELLKQAYAAGKSATKPTPVEVVILAAPTTGNNYQWLQQMYNAGAKGSFDAVSVHTDTACLDRAPDFFYRDPSSDPLQQGPIGQFAFLGYRSVYEVMKANGDGDKKIWMTEIGWSSTGGGPTSCSRGDNAGKKPSGVSEADQAAFLTKGFACMANDPYVETAAWFTLYDTNDPGVDEFRHYGLFRADKATPKPSLNAFLALNPAQAGECGDFTPPSIRVVSPTDDLQFVDKFDIKVSASDSGVGLGRISAYINKVDLTPFSSGGGEIKNWTTALANDKVLDDLSPWQNSGKLPLGRHTLIVRALDLNGNAGEKRVTITKVAPGTIASTLTPKYKFGKKPLTCKGRTCTFRGSLQRGVAGSPSIGGKVNVEWQFRNKKGKWVKLVGGLKPANKAFTFKAKLKFKGRWRVRAVYAGQAPWKKASSKYFTFRVK